MRQVRSSRFGVMLGLVVLVLAMPARGAVGAWTSIGPPGGAVEALAVDPQQSNFVYAALTVGGIYRSDDGGVSWQRLPTPFLAGNNRLALDVVVDPNDSMRVLALQVNNVWQSLDRGLTWTPWANAGEIVPWIRDLRFDPSNPLRLYGNSPDNGIFRSDDDGATWVPAGLSDLSSRHRWVVAADGALFACDIGTTGIYKSTNQGASWAPANSGFSAVPANAALAADPTDAMRLYAASNLGFYTTTNGGSSWSPAGTGLPLAVAQVMVDPASATTIYALSGSALYRSTDSGANFSLHAASVAPSPRGLVADPAQPGRFFTPTVSAGVFRSVDSGASWTKSETGFHASRILSLAVTTASPARIVAGTDRDDAYLSNDGGTTWTKPTGSPFASSAQVQQVAAHPLVPLTLFAGADVSPGFFRSDDGGSTWTGLLAASGWPIGKTTGVAFDPTDAMKVFAAHGTAGVFKSTDGGSTWTSASTGLPSPSSSNLFGPLALDPLAPARMYVGFTSGGLGRTYRTGDGGGFWGQPAPSFTLDFGFGALAVDPNLAGTLFVTGEGKVYRSDTLALSWVDRTAGLPSPLTRAPLAIDPVASANVYIGTLDGVYASTDRGLTWARLGSELTGRIITALALDPANPKRVLAGVEGGGVWELTVPSLFADGFETGDTSAWSVMVP